MEVQLSVFGRQGSHSCLICCRPLEHLLRCQGRSQIQAAGRHIPGLAPRNGILAPGQLCVNLRGSAHGFCMERAENRIRAHRCRALVPGNSPVCQVEAFAITSLGLQPGKIQQQVSGVVAGEGAGVIASRQGFRRAIPPVQAIWMPGMEDFVQFVGDVG